MLSFIFVEKNNIFLLTISFAVLLNYNFLACDNLNALITSYNYTQKYENYSKKINQNNAVLITAHNRPKYFEMCIKSIERNPESQTLPFIFALDGGPESKQKENIKIIEASTIKHKIILLRTRNYGCPKNHIDSKRFAFEWCKFKKVIVMEEDLIITPSYFTFILNLHEWATNNFDNVGAVQAWSQCYLSLGEKLEQRNLVHENPQYWSFVTYCIDHHCWKKIRKLLYTFEDFVDEIPHSDEFSKARSKPALWQGMGKIRDWVQKSVKQKMKKKITLNSSLLLTQGFLSPKFQPAQDIIMGFSFYMNDLIKLKTVVNRVLHIGQIGISMTQEKYENEYRPMTLDIFKDDSSVKTFTLM